MEPNKILSANILDLIFDGRNKDYGAYELRVTYPERIKRSMIVVFILAAVTITGVALASNYKPKESGLFKKTEIVIQQIDEEKPVEPPPPEQPKPQPPQIKSVAFNNIVLTDKDVPPLPTQDDFKDAKIDVKTEDGASDIGIVATNTVDDNKNIIEAKPVDDDGIHPVEIEAKYDGDWTKFLTRNLNAEIPIENGAPAGRYSIMIQFVVDREGNISDITPLTNFGFGMEQEAVRVLKKAKGWKPGIQNGREVKSYRRQPITFIVEEQ